MVVSDKPWSDFSESDYDLEQWKNSTLVDSGQGDPGSKDRYKLPVREPNGDLNSNGVHAAAARIDQVQPANKRAAAARKLISLYRNELHEDPPDTLTGMGERSASQIERAYTTSWSELKSIEVRSAPGGGLSRTIGGYAAVYGVRSQPLGGYREIVENRFFAKSQGDNWPGVVARYEHQPSMLLGTTAAGTLRVTSDSYGLQYDVDLPEHRSDTLESVMRGDTRSSSFAFLAFQDDWRPGDGGYPTRHLVSGRLIDVAPTAVPAYPDATVAMRSLAAAKNADPYEVELLAQEDNLRVLFVRTDNIDRRRSVGEETRTAPTQEREPAVNIIINAGAATVEPKAVESEVAVVEPEPVPEVVVAEVTPESEAAKPVEPEPAPVTPEPLPTMSPQEARLRMRAKELGIKYE